MQAGPELTTLVAIGLVAVVLLVFVLQVLGSVRRLASELRLMREALQITVREVHPAQTPEAPGGERPVSEAAAEPEAQRQPEPAQPAWTTETLGTQEAGPPAPQPPPQPPPAPTPEEQVRFGSLEEIARHFDLKGVVLFDSAGQVIDYVGDVEAEKVAALLAEAYSVISMSNEGVRVVLLEDDVSEAVARLEVVGEREVYVYLRSSGRAPPESLRRAVGSCSSLLRAMLGVRRD